MAETLTIRAVFDEPELEAEFAEPVNLRAQFAEPANIGVTLTQRQILGAGADAIGDEGEFIGVD